MELLLLSADVCELAEELPEVALSLPPPLPLLDAELLEDVLPPVAVAPLLFDALPLFDTVCVEFPPLPPVALLVALPEFPELAVDELDPSLDELLELALPELPVAAWLPALPPLESLDCDCFTLPDDEEEFCALVFEEADALPDVAEPLPDPPEPLFDALLLPLVEPPEAVALLEFCELPEPDALCELLPPLPPLAVLVALPELPEFAVLALDPSLDELVEVAPPVLPDWASLCAFPPFESFDCDWVTDPLALLEFVDDVWLEALHVPEDELPPPPEFDEPDEQFVEPDANTKWFSTVCTTKKVSAAAISAMATLTNTFFAMVTIASLSFISIRVVSIDASPITWGGGRCCDVSCEVLAALAAGGARPD
ncbi:MAG: hypothetical protein JOY68_08315 [Candidatus Dormibacteraeota bacterium]|nr:hypothetical protein [Candidatus Dormibacteraeota bacterium]